MAAPDVRATPSREHGLSGLADASAFLARLTRLDPAALVRLRSGVAGGPPGSAPRTVLWARLPWAVLVGRVVAGAGPGDATVSAAALLAELDRGGAGLPARRDADWRWPLPGLPGLLVETIAGADLRRIAAAAAGTLRTAATDGIGGRAVGERALRDALLDHVAVVVTGPPSARSPSPGRVGGVAEPATDPPLPSSAEAATPVGGAATAVGEPATASAEAATAAAEAGDPSAGERIEVSQRLIQAVVRMGFLGSAGSAGRDAVQVRTLGRWVGLSAPFGVAWLQKVSQLAIRPTRDHPNV